MPSTYRQLRRVYKGNRHSVSRARRDDGREVIIKQVLPGRGEKRAVERLAHELEVLRGLHLPHISRLLDSTTLNGQLALVLEDAGPRNLSEMLRSRPLALDIFFDLAVQMTRIIGAVHEHNLVHRDVSPDNFVLSEAGSEVTLVDFDLTTTVPVFAQTPEAPNALEGSLAYMAPESAGHMTRLVDRRADLYALGCTFYTMLTGRPPFRARDPLQLVHEHAARDPYPPAILNTSIPTLISDIVVKLLAKRPEWRYQTSETLRADLEEAQRQWRDNGKIIPFELGRRDLPRKLLLPPEKLYGRNRETALLIAAIERARGGASEMLLVKGNAGIGKSSLVAHVRELTERDVRWFAGKADPLFASVPYAPLIDACRELVRTAFQAPEDEISALRERLRELRPSCHVLCEAIPELEELVGDLPSPRAVEAREAGMRFQLAFLALVRALITDQNTAFVLFLDDLEWLDAASRTLVGMLASDPETESLLILGAYRSEEVGPEHPLAQTIDGLRAGGGSVIEIELGPLDRESMLALICNSLRCEPQVAERLAEVIRQKTGANPLLTRQFLGILYRKGLLMLDPESGEWSWDLEGIEAEASVTDADELLAMSLTEEPARARDALRAAACIRDRFELNTLAGMRDESPNDTAQALWVPIEQGVVVPAMEGQRFDWLSGTPVELETAIAPTFRFAHDRIRQVIYASIPEDEREALHRKIGRWLDDNVPADSFDAAVVAITDQLNRAIGELSEEQRVRLAHLNERAGRQARSTSAFKSALRYFQTGLSLLPHAAWRGELHPLWFSLHSGAAECAALGGDFGLSDELVDAGLSHTEEAGLSRADAALEKTRLLAISVQANALRGEHTLAIERGREGLAALGMEVPDPITAEDVDAARRRADSAVAGLSDEQLIKAPDMDDPLDRARLELLATLTSTWFVARDLFQVLACRAVELTATKGIAPTSATSYAGYAMVMSMAGEYERAARYGSLAAELAARLDNPAEESRVLLVLGGHISAWRAPVTDSLALLRRSYALALESGNLEFAAYALEGRVFMRMLKGTELDQVLVEAKSAITYFRKVRHLSGVPCVLPFVQAVKCLKGMTQKKASFDDDEFEEARFLTDAEENGLGQAVFHVLRLQATYLLGPELASSYVEKSARWLRYFRTVPFQVEFHFYAALTFAQVASSAARDQRASALSRLREHLTNLETWSLNAPANFRHKRDLVAAELARLEGRVDEALDLYHSAIERSGDAGFLQDEALAHELCGRSYRDRGADRMAELHLGAALERYWLWGALAKVDALEEEFPSLQLGGKPRQLTATTSIDYLGLVAAIQAVTEELELDRLIEKLMQTCAHAAMAPCGALVLDEDGLQVRAAINELSEVVLLRSPLASSSRLPISLIQDVFSSGELLALGNAARKGRYTSDPYIAANNVTWVLAVPIARAGRSLGVLYFENNLASDGFPAERIEMFRLLSSTIAIALENSRLYEAEKRSQASLELLANASVELAATLEYSQILEKLASVAVPGLADWCVVDSTENGRLAPVSWAHVHPASAPRVEELHRKYPADRSSAQHHAMQTGESVLIPEVTEEVLRAGCRDEEHLRLSRALSPCSAMICPLVARERTMGVVTFVSSHPNRRYDDADRAVAEALVTRMGLALDNARLYRDLKRSVQERQDRDRYLRLIFGHLQGAVWATDRDLRLTYATGDLPSVPELERLAGTTVYDFLETHDPTEPGIAHHLAALAGENQSFEYPLRGRWFEVQVNPVRDNAGDVVGCVGAAIDVTEKREAAEQLAQSERRLREAQELAHVGSFEWDFRRDLLTWSDELLRIYGLSAGEFEGNIDAFIKRVHPDDAAGTKSALFESYRSARPFLQDHRIIRPDGSIRILHTRGDVVTDESGEALRVAGACWDITELTDATAARERLLSLLQATIEATDDGILVVDQDRKVTVYNHRFLEMWHVDAQLADGSDEETLLDHVLDQIESPSEFQRGVAEHRADPAAEHIDVVRFRDGRVFERYSRPQRIDGTIAGRVWSFRDISKSERLLQNALFLADASRLLVSLEVEPALESVAHLAVRMIADGCAIDLYEDGERRRLIAVSRDEARPFAPRVRSDVLEGKPVRYREDGDSILGAPALIKGQPVCTITLRAAPGREYTTEDTEVLADCASRASLAIENTRLYRHLRKALQARDEFLAIAAHEIRGPITSIHLAVQSMRKKKVPPAAMPRLLELVEREDKRLSHFVDELLDLGRIRAGRLRLELEEVDLADVVHDVVARLNAQISSSGSELEVDVNGDVVGQWDKAKLDQVVSNLLSNAIKFGLGKPIELRLNGRNSHVRLEVQDHGMGIEREIQKRIFDPFERGVSIRHHGGLGLGLYIVRSIVHALGGSIKVDSKPGVGAIFRVALPKSRLASEEHIEGGIRDAYLGG